MIRELVSPPPPMPVCLPPRVAPRPPEVLTIDEARGQVRAVEAVLEEASKIARQHARAFADAETSRSEAERELAQAERRFTAAPTDACALAVTRAQLIVKRAVEAHRAANESRSAAESHVQTARDALGRAQLELQRAEALERVDLSHLHEALRAPAAWFASALGELGESLEELLGALGHANELAAAARAIDVDAPQIGPHVVLVALVDALEATGVPIIVRNGPHESGSVDFRALCSALDPKAPKPSPLHRLVEVILRLGNFRITTVRAGDDERSKRLRRHLGAHRTLAAALVAVEAEERAAMPVRPIPHFGPTAEELERRFAPAPAPVRGHPEAAVDHGTNLRPVARIGVVEHVAVAMGPGNGWSTEVEALRIADTGDAEE